MANEVSIIELFGANNSGDPTSYTIASDATVTKGTHLVLSADPRTVTKQSGTGQVFVGVAMMDKDGTDYTTRISAATNLIGDVIASGAITYGQLVKTAAGVASNAVMGITNADAAIASYGTVVGMALETASDGEVIAVDYRWHR